MVVTVVVTTVAAADREAEAVGLGSAGQEGGKS
jgi:hypothetical protein